MGPCRAAAWRTYVHGCVNHERLRAHTAELPCIVESHKTLDPASATYYKNGDISGVRKDGAA